MERTKNPLWHLMQTLGSYVSIRDQHPEDEAYSLVCIMHLFMMLDKLLPKANVHSSWMDIQDL